MSSRRQSGLSPSAREALLGVVSRLKMSQPAADLASPFESMTDFTTLPGFRELKLQRSMADLVGIENPFFRLHDQRAGATTVIGGQTFHNFSSYDYLGLNAHPEVAAAAIAAIGHYGTSASASRVVAGERPIHRALEELIAQHYGQEDSIVFVSGHATNVSTISTLLGPKDLIVYDSLAHNSIITGAAFSGAERQAFAHNDPIALNSLLEAARPRYQRVLIVIEGLYSMDGDFPDLKAFVEIKRRHGAWLMVDEAHSLGVLGKTGRGLFEQCDVDPRDVDLWMGTLSKTLAGCGGYIAGCKPLVEILKCTAGGFVYSVGLSPPIAAAALTALTILHREPERVERLRANGDLFRSLARAQGLDTGLSTGLAIIPLVLGDSLIAVALGQELFTRGINVQPIIHPAVPEKSARLRFFVTSEHREDQIRETIVVASEALKVIGDGKSILTRAK